MPDDGLQADGVGIKEWRTLNGSTLLPEVVKGIVFVDGVKGETRRLKNLHPQHLTIPLPTPSRGEIHRCGSTVRA